MTSERVEADNSPAAAEDSVISEMHKLGTSWAQVGSVDTQRSMVVDEYVDE